MILQPSQGEFGNPCVTRVLPREYLEIPLHRERENQYGIQGPAHAFGQRCVAHASHNQADAKVATAHCQRAQLVLSLGAEDDVINNNQDRPLFFEGFLLL